MTRSKNVVFFPHGTSDAVIAAGTPAPTLRSSTETVHGAQHASRPPVAPILDIGSVRQSSFSTDRPIAYRPVLPPSAQPQRDPPAVVDSTKLVHLGKKGYGVLFGRLPDGRRPSPAWKTPRTGETWTESEAQRKVASYRMRSVKAVGAFVDWMASMATPKASTRSGREEE